MRVPRAIDAAALRLLAAVFIAGCGASDGGPTVVSEDSAVADSRPSETAREDAGGEDDAVVAVDTGGTPVDAPTPSAYPSGPYGTAVGSVVADLELVGYIRDATTGLATEATYEPAKLSDVRARAKVKYALIHVSGFT